MVINNLVFQWYRINEWIDGYKILTLSIALSDIYFASYCMGENNYSVLPAAYNLTGSFDWFDGTTINFAFRGGNEKLYIRHGWIFIIGV